MIPLVLPFPPVSFPSSFIDAVAPTSLQHSHLPSFLSFLPNPPSILQIPSSSIPVLYPSTIALQTFYSIQSKARCWTLLPAGRELYNILRGSWIPVLLLPWQVEAIPTKLHAGPWIVTFSSPAAFDLFHAVVYVLGTTDDISVLMQY